MSLTRDGRGRSPLAAAVEESASPRVVETVLRAVPFGRHSVEEQRVLLDLARRGADPSLMELVELPVPFGAPTAAR